MVMSQQITVDKNCSKTVKLIKYSEFEFCATQEARLGAFFLSSVNPPVTLIFTDRSHCLFKSEFGLG